METRKAKTKVAATVLALAGLLLFSLFAVGGSLEPSAPPGPTMKTLDEVEPRIPIPPAPGRDPASTFVISESGSYYLTGDRSCSGTGIEVTANNVTIDLMGYSLIGAGSGTNYGISMNGRSNVEIRNGTVRNFDRGIYESDTSGKNHRIINVRAASNDLDGIHLKGSNHLVKNCTASDNGTSASSYVYGIYVGIAGTVTGNKAYSNGTSATSLVFGIFAGLGSTVTGNTCYDNNHDGIYANGSTVTGNTCYENDDNGIQVDQGCTVTGNTSYGNVGIGINVSFYCLVDQNTAYSNGTNMVTGTGCVLGTNCAP